LAYSPDGKRLATHSYDGTAKVFDAESGQEILKLKVRLPDHRNGDVVFSPDGKRLAVSCLSSDYSASSGGIGEVKILDSATGNEQLSLKGHTAIIRNLVFSLDGKRLASSAAQSGRRGGELKLWDTETGHELLTLSGDGYNGDVAFGGGGNWLAADVGGTVRIYDATPLPEQP